MGGGRIFRSGPSFARVRYYIIMLESEAYCEHYTLQIEEAARQANAHEFIASFEVYMSHMHSCAFILILSGFSL